MKFGSISVVFMDVNDVFFGTMMFLLQFFLFVDVNDVWYMNE